MDARRTLSESELLLLNLRTDATMMEEKWGSGQRVVNSMRQAADEIERLREALRVAHGIVRDAGDRRGLATVERALGWES